MMADEESDEFRRFVEGTVTLEEVIDVEPEGSFEGLFGRIAGPAGNLTLWASAGIIAGAGLIAVVSPQPEAVGGDFWRAGREHVQGLFGMLDAVGLPLLLVALVALLVAAVAHHRPVPDLVAAGEPIVAALGGGIVGLLWVGVIALVVVNLAILALIIVAYVVGAIIFTALVLGMLWGLVTGG